MEIMNCKRCNRVFTPRTLNMSYCSNCYDYIDGEFQKIRKFLRDFPNSDIRLTSEKTGVDERLILKFIRSERIELTKDSNILIDCTICGKPIHTGEYCVECKHKLDASLNTVSYVKKPVKGATSKERMHLERYRKK